MDQQRHAAASIVTTSCMVHLYKYISECIIYKQKEITNILFKSLNMCYQLYVSSGLHSRSQRYVALPSRYDLERTPKTEFTTKSVSKPVLLDHMTEHIHEQVFDMKTLKKYCLLYNSILKLVKVKINKHIHVKSIKTMRMVFR